MAETTEQKPTAPVKSEETAIVLLKKELGRVEEEYLREFDRDAMEFPQLPKIRELNESIRFLESRSTHTLVPNELWAEIKRVVEDYADNALWSSRDQECAYEDVWNRSENGYEPAQLVLAKMEGEKK